MKVSAQNTVTIRPLYHRDKRHIGLYFTPKPVLINQIKSLSSSKYTKTHKCWYIPYTKQDYKNFKKLEISFIVDKNNTNFSANEKTIADIDSSTPLSYSEPVLYRTADISSVNTRAKVVFNNYHFIIKLKYNETDVDFLKSLSKCWWNADQKSWIVKASVLSLQRLQHHFSFWHESQYQFLHELISTLEFPKRLTLYNLPQYKTKIAIRLEGFGIDHNYLRKKTCVQYEKSIKRYIAKKDDKIINQILSHYSIRGVEIIDRYHNNLAHQQKTVQELLDIYIQKTKDENKSLCKEVADTILKLGMSWNTFRAYIGSIIKLKEYHPDTDLLDLSNEDLDRYLSEMVANSKTQTAYNRHISAIKFFYEKVKYSEKLHLQKIHRPKKCFVLPTILSVADVLKMFEVTLNIKHKTILHTIYACGLRQSEVLNLRLEDIMWDRNQVFIRQSKGKKDRIVMLSEVLKKSLTQYCEKYKPIYWLFEGKYGGQYTSSTLQKLVKQTATRAGIRKKVTCHTLRHCFATHLMDGGIGVKMIQQLLGHKDIKTTMIYTHISQENINKVISPLDKIIMKKTE